MTSNLLICDISGGRIMKQYLQSHKETRYLPTEKLLPGLKRYRNHLGWDDFYLGENLIFSHRLNPYDVSAFPEKLHTHNFYELDIYESGDISYIADNHEIFPNKGDIIIFPPGLLHTARLAQKSQYARYVFYFNAELFDFLGHDNLPLLFKNSHVNCRFVEPEKKCELFYLLEKIEYAVRQENMAAGLLAFGFVIQLFCLISNHTLLKVRLFTGRTHQIRVHLASIGHPLVNDNLYGTPGPQARHALHAYRLAFKHPVSDVFLEITRSLPNDLLKLLY